MQRVRFRNALIGTGITSLLALALTGAALAQDATPSSSPAVPSLATDDRTFAADIVEGTCERVGGVVFPLGRISPDLIVHSEPADGRRVGSTSDDELAINLTIVAASLDELVSDGHALLISAGTAEADDPEEVGRPIACGDIGGTVIEGDTLVIRLDEVDGSGYLGFGLLEQRGSDDTTTVQSVLTESVREPVTREGATASPSASGSPAAQPSPSVTPDASPAPDASPTASTPPPDQTSDEQAAGSPSSVPSMAADPGAADRELTVTVTVEDSDEVLVSVTVEVPGEASPDPSASTSR